MAISTPPAISAARIVLATSGCPFTRFSLVGIVVPIGWKAPAAGARGIGLWRYVALDYQKTSTYLLVSMKKLCVAGENVNARPGIQLWAGCGAQRRRRGWKAAPIMWPLRDVPQRFGELRREVPGISEKMLIQQLKELELDEWLPATTIRKYPPAWNML